MEINGWKMFRDVGLIFVIGLVILMSPAWLPLLVASAFQGPTGCSEYDRPSSEFTAGEVEMMAKVKKLVQRNRSTGLYCDGGYWVKWPTDALGRPWPENDYGLPYDPSIPGDKNGLMSGYGREAETLKEAFGK